MSEQRYGVLIASSQYQDQRLGCLRFPENDVDGLNEILSSKDYGNFNEISVLKNRPHHEILLKINQILKKAKKDDLVLIYYSGHGKLNEAGKLHLATTDTDVDSLEATSLPVDSIKSYMDISPANKFVLILDSCFSGAAGNVFTKGSVEDQLLLASGGRGTYIMTGSTGIQVASEKVGDSFGVFTKHIIEGIKGGGAADDNGLVTMDGLYNYVHDHVLKESSQEPMKWNLNVRGDLVISGGGKSKRAERAEQIRAMLLDLANKNLLPDFVLSTSLKIIKMKPQQLNYEDSRHNELIDRLFRKEIELNSFIEEWVNIGKEGPVVAPEKETLIKKLYKENLTSTSFGQFWTQEKFKAMTAVYLIGLYWQFSYDLINYPYWFPSELSEFIILGLLPLLGLVIAIVSYRIRLSKGIYLGLLDPLILLMLFTNYTYLKLGSDSQLIDVLLLSLVAIVSTVFYWQIFITPSDPRITKITPPFKIFRK